MSLAEDLQILVKRGAHYGFQRDVLAEVPHFARDLLFGASRGRKDPAYLYADFHLHLPRTVLMRRVLEKVSPRVDICSIVTREPKHDADGGYLDFDTAVEKLKREGLPIRKEDARFVEVSYNDSPFYFLRAIEVYGKEGQELVVVGDDHQFRDNRVNDRPLDDLLVQAKDLGALGIVDHGLLRPTESPVHFLFLNDDQERQFRGWIERHNPIIETWNHQNTLWVFPANVAVQRIAREYGSPEVADSDSHFRLQEIGLSRTGLPRSLLEYRSGDAFVASLDFALRNHRDEVRLEGGYSSIWAFSQYMVLPTLLWRLGMNKSARRVRGITD